MWKLNKIEAINLCAFRELTYALTQGVTTLVFGDNRDNENQRSNGSGKSALIESIALGISGSPLRKVRNEEIINDNAEECKVKLYFANDSCDEEFIVSRTIYRKGSALVNCSIIRDGKKVTTDEAVCSSVDAYNKYILDKLGITKDELFNNFILSRHKYQDFLSCSDKEKKEIINHFSNGNLVDQAIRKIIEDTIPLQNDIHALAMELAGIDGRIQVLTEQIEQEKKSREEKSRTKTEKIDSMLQSIAEKRNLVRVKQTHIDEMESNEKSVYNIEKKAQALEDSETSAEDCLPLLTEMLASSITSPLTDWKRLIQSKKQDIMEDEEDLAEWEDTITGIENRVKVCKKHESELNADFNTFLSSYTENKRKFSLELDSIEEKTTTATEQLQNLKISRQNLLVVIEKLKGKLAGTISCPSCSHQFVLADKEFSVLQAKEELEINQKKIQEIEQNVQKYQEIIDEFECSRTVIEKQSSLLDSTKNDWESKLSKAKRELNNVEYELENATTNQKRITDSIYSKQKEIKEIRRKVFDEVFELIEAALKTYERNKQGLVEEIKSIESSIQTLQQTINELNQSTGNEMLESLQQSLKAAQAQSSTVLSQKADVEETYNRLAEQQQLFVNFKTYLANTKIEALSRMTNEILEDIGSDIRICFSGYTVLKSGNVREKISASLLRDGIDCGSFGKFSEGEKARVNLATIIAMQRLVNGNCDIDKGLDLLVIDELLDSFDEAGLACMFSALNKLGITALVVSHGHTSESYPYKITIVKQHGVSEIKQ